MQQQIASFKTSSNLIGDLQEKMETSIPHIENNVVIIYTAIEGKDADGVLRRREAIKHVRPQLVGRHRLRAIQLTTAAPLLQAAQHLLDFPQ